MYKKNHCTRTFIKSVEAILYDFIESFIKYNLFYLIITNNKDNSNLKLINANPIPDFALVCSKKCKTCQLMSNGYGYNLIYYNNSIKYNKHFMTLLDILINIEIYGFIKKNNDLAKNLISAIYFFEVNSKF